MKDCAVKGRDRINAEYLKGEAVITSKLTTQNVEDIKRRLQNNEKVCNISLIYNFVNRNAIQDIKDNKTWKHVII